MRKIYKYIGTCKFDEFNALMGDYYWAPLNYGSIPLASISMPNGFILARGSACPISLATTSLSGITYNGALDIVRWDINDRTFPINIDRYLISPSKEVMKLYPDAFGYHKPKGDTDTLWDILMGLYDIHSK